MIGQQFFTFNYQWLAYAGAIFSSIIGFLTFGLFTRRNREMRSKILINMEIAMFFLAFAALVDWVLFTINGVNPVLRESFDYISLGSYISFTCNAISNVFLYKFTLAVFEEQVNMVLYYIITSIQLLVIPFLYVYFFMFSEIPEFEMMELIILGVHILCSFTIYVVLIKNSTKLRKKMTIDTTEDIPVKKGLGYMSLTGLLMFLAVLMFIVHEVMLMIPVREYITVSLGWILGSIAGVFIYIGYIAPKWLRDRWIRAASL